jgi:hypothetical protein
MQIVWNVDCGSDARAIIMSFFRSQPRDSAHHPNDGKMNETMPPTASAIYKQHRLESWDAFLKIITGSPYSNWAFRGHCKEEWPLASALSRYFRNFHVDRLNRG